MPFDKVKVTLIFYRKKYFLTILNIAIIAEIFETDESLLEIFFYYVIASVSKIMHIVSLNTMYNVSSSITGSDLVQQR